MIILYVPWDHESEMWDDLLKKTIS